MRNISPDKATYVGSGDKIGITGSHAVDIHIDADGTVSRHFQRTLRSNVQTAACSKVQVAVGTDTEGAGGIMLNIKGRIVEFQNSKVNQFAIAGFIFGRSNILHGDGSVFQIKLCLFRLAGTVNNKHTVQNNVTVVDIHSAVDVQSRQLTTADDIQRAVNSNGTCKFLSVEIKVQISSCRHSQRIAGISQNSDGGTIRHNFYRSAIDSDSGGFNCLFDRIERQMSAILGYHIACGIDDHRNLDRNGTVQDGIDIRLIGTIPQRGCLPKVGRIHIVRCITGRDQSRVILDGQIVQIADSGGSAVGHARSGQGGQRTFRKSITAQLQRGNGFPNICVCQFNRCRGNLGLLRVGQFGYRRTVVPLGFRHTGFKFEVCTGRITCKQFVCMFNRPAVCAIGDVNGERTAFFYNCNRILDPSGKCRRIVGCQSADQVIAGSALCTAA